MYALLSHKEDIENLISEYRFYAAFQFDPKQFPAITIEEPVLETCG